MENSRFKFKAWDKKEKCWVCGFSIHNSGLFSDMIKGEINESGVCIANCNWQKLNELQHIKVMQFTGLYDKNGKEIYDGDIISYFGIKYEVLFRNGAFGWMENGEFYSFSEMTPSVFDEFEVIGNVYENPELLEESK